MPLTGLYTPIRPCRGAFSGVRLPKTYSNGFRSVQPAFGRQEVVELEGRNCGLFLAKKPAGANQCAVAA